MLNFCFCMPLAYAVQHRAWECAVSLRFLLWFSKNVVRDASTSTLDVVKQIIVPATSHTKQRWAYSKSSIINMHSGMTPHTSHGHKTGTRSKRLQ